MPGRARLCRSRAAGTAALRLEAPYRGFALALQHFYPEACAQGGDGRRAAIPPVHPTARLEDDVDDRARRSHRTRSADRARHDVAAGAVIGYRVTIGRGCYIGPGAS